MKVSLDHARTKGENKAEHLAGHRFADEPGDQVAARHVDAAVEDLVVVRVDWQHGPLQHKGHREHHRVDDPRPFQTF